MAADDFVTAWDGIRLFVRLNGHGEPSLVVPGIGAETDFGDLCTTRRVAFFDIRNRGRSDAVPVDGSVGIPIEIDDIDAVRTQVGFATASILGWSYAGLIAALYAARYPKNVERLVMVCPVPPSASLQASPVAADPVLVQRLRELAETRLATTDPVAFARAWRRIAIPPRMGDPTAFETLRADPSIWPNEWPEHMTDALRRVFATHPADFDYRVEARQISAPTLIIHGGVDAIPLAASEEWTRTIPNARLLVLDGIGHFPHAETASAFFDAVRTFLDGDWPAHARDLST